MTHAKDRLAPAITADRADLPADVAAALDRPPGAEPGVVEAAGVPFATEAWGDPAAPPILLIHGVTASARIWWRVGPALAVGLGRRVIALDQAGHGRTGHWTGHHRFADNAADLAAFIAAAGLARPDLGVVGHSWGALTAAALPAAGVTPRALVLLDPPAIPVAEIATMLDDPIERHYDDLAEAIAALGELHPAWPYGDILAKAEALTQFDEPAVRAILTGNGDWDGGLAALADPAAADVPTWLIRGEPASGGLIPDDQAERFAVRIGFGRVVTIGGGAHSPMRLRPEATTLALLRALGPAVSDPMPGTGQPEPGAAGRQGPGGAAEPEPRAGGPPPAEEPAPDHPEARTVAGRVASALGEAADHLESAASAVGAAVGATVRRFDERAGARVRRVRRLGNVPLPYLYDARPDARGWTPRELGVQTIDVADIAGTAVGGAQQRGSDFLPLKPFRSLNWSARWQRLRQASDRLAILPPIDVLRVGDRYWVLDGHNRVALALYNGQGSIDADVTELQDPARPGSGAAESFASFAEDSLELRAAVTRTGSGRAPVARPAPTAPTAEPPPEPAPEAAVEPASRRPSDAEPPA